MSNKKLRNYTTSIPAARSAAQIEEKLWKLGCVEVSKTGQGGTPTSISFVFQHQSESYEFKIRVQHEGVLNRLSGMKLPKSKQTRARALDIAWRTTGELLDIQIDAIMNQTASPMETWATYLVGPSGETIQDRIQAGVLPDVKLLLP